MATFIITRNSTSLLSNPLTLNFAVSGTATYNVDYTVSGADSFSATAAVVIIPANQTQKTLTIAPVPDTTIEGDETVILTFVPENGVSVAGVNPSATLTIVNDDNINQSLTYVSNGDANGLFYWLGTNKGTTAWSNPSSQLTYSRQGTGNFNNFPNLTNRIVNSHPDNTWLETSPYLRVDLGANLKLIPNYYSIRSWINNDRLPRNWKIQGSNDATTWTDLDTVANNTTITTNSQWLSRPLSGNTAYRYLQYLCTTPGDSNNVVEVALSEWEFYGTAQII